MKKVLDGLDARRDIRSVTRQALARLALATGDSPLGDIGGADVGRVSLALPAPAESVILQRSPW
ncbi:MAG: hypothetical protein WBW81_00210 [Methylocella sp.]